MSRRDSSEDLDQLSFRVNGEPHRGPRGMTLEDLVAELGLGDRRIATEVNMKVVPRADYAEIEIREDDRIEIVSFVGGG